MIKTIGDEVLFVADDPRAAAEVALLVTERGADDEDQFPRGAGRHRVRRGGQPPRRRLRPDGQHRRPGSTSVARPGTVLLDRGRRSPLGGPADGRSTRGYPAREADRQAADELAELSPYSEPGDYRFRRMPRRAVKGYSRLEPFVLRRRRPGSPVGSRAPGPAMDMQRPWMTSSGADSEVGRLQTVMLHRPGPELKRLTPRNNDKLLFDGIPWVSRAQDEHDGFAEALRSRGVEVLYLTDLLTETLAEEQARSHAITTALGGLHLGDTMRTYLAHGSSRTRRPRS